MSRLDTDERWKEAWKLIPPVFDGHYSASKEQQERLFKLALTLGEGDKIVEIGVCNGRTAALLAYTTKYTGADYTGIDSFVLENSAENIRSQFTSLELPGTIIYGDSRRVPRIPDISLLFVDGGHDQYSVEPDCALWVPQVVAGGYAAFHDYDEPFDLNSAHWAVRHFADKATRGWKKIDYYGGLAIFQKP